MKSYTISNCWVTPWKTERHNFSILHIETSACCFSRLYREPLPDRHWWMCQHTLQKWRQMHRWAEQLYLRVHWRYKYHVKSKGLLNMFDQQLGSQSNKPCHFKRNLRSLGYSGRHCETDINECYSDPCHYGTCIDGLASFSCQCKPGYTGRLCETNINECLSQPCRNGGTCQDRENAYICSCPKGTTGSQKVGCDFMTPWLWPFYWEKSFLSQESTAKSTLMTAKAIPATMEPALTKSMGTSVPVNLATQVSNWDFMYRPSQYNVMRVEPVFFWRWFPLWKSI